jgi:hypothetical protein
MLNLQSKKNTPFYFSIRVEAIEKMIMFVVRTQIMQTMKIQTFSKKQASTGTEQVTSSHLRLRLLFVVLGLFYTYKL